MGVRKVEVPDLMFFVFGEFLGKGRVTFWLYFFCVNWRTVPSLRPQKRDSDYLLEWNLMAVILVFSTLLLDCLGSEAF